MAGDTMKAHEARIAELERRAAVNDAKLDTLAQKVSEFVGEAKGVNRALAVIVGLATITQLVIEVVFSKK